MKIFGSIISSRLLNTIKIPYLDFLESTPIEFCKNLLINILPFTESRDFHNKKLFIGSTRFIIPKKNMQL